MPIQEELAIATLLLLASMSVFSGCASAPQLAKNTEETQALHAQLKEMSARMETLESKLDTQLKTTQNSLDTLLANSRATPTPVPAPPAGAVGKKPPPRLSPNDPDAGFEQSEAVQLYREAAILMATQKYPEAVLAYSSFLEQNPDHPLAGSAQYQIGNAYFKQKEYKLALSEYERVLTSYDRSPQVPDTLLEMAECEDFLKRSEKAAQHRQLLTSLFPQSPAAASLMRGEAPGKPEPAPVLDTPPTAPPTAPMVPHEGHSAP